MHLQADRSVFSSNVKRMRGTKCARDSGYSDPTDELTKKVDSSLPEIEMDGDQMRQVMVNIITNAVQAMPEGGKMTVTARQKDGFIGVAIADTGVGIPEEAIGKVFDPLYTMKAKGIGLGLAVCRSIVERHEGHIGVKSIVGKGTTFTIKLPLNAK